MLPVGGYLGNVPAPTLATLQADISRGYVRLFVLPVSPPGPDPRQAGEQAAAGGPSHAPDSPAGARPAGVDRASPVLVAALIWFQ